jgi:hypothetical protein
MSYNSEEETVEYNNEIIIPFPITIILTSVDHISFTWRLVGKKDVNTEYKPYQTDRKQ